MDKISVDATEVFGVKFPEPVLKGSGDQYYHVIVARLESLAFSGKTPQESLKHARNALKQKEDNVVVLAVVGHDKAPFVLKSRHDLIFFLRQKVNKIHPVDRSQLTFVADLLEKQQWAEALKAAEKMDTIVREEIPNWAWQMMETAIKAQEKLKQYG